MLQTTKPLSIIVAVAENYAIGKNNQLLWHISEDLKWFKKNTSGHTVIMGKNTYYSLPFQPLPKRRNIVISDVKGELIQGCDMAYNIEDAVSLADNYSENFIIGGASIYKQFFPIVQKLYITWVHKLYEADTFFPIVDEKEWLLIEKINQQETQKDELVYDFCIYQKK
jgi:dihydrofolate reductase